jgi:Tol biopolymer transport system component
MNPDGSDEALLRANPGDESYAAPAWSPDGRRLVFVLSTYDAATDTYSDGELFLINADGSGLAQLTDNGVDDHGPAWSPDGQRIAYARRQPSGYGEELRVIDAAGNDTLLSPCTPPSQSGSGPCSGRTDLSWSPDGQKIAFTSNSWFEETGEEQQFFPLNYYVDAINADGSNKVELTVGGKHPDWSPDGNRIVFQGHPFDSIFVMNADGSGEAPVASDPVQRFHTPVWSPNGLRIAVNVSTSADPFGNVWTMKTDGTDRMQVAASLAHDPAWQRRTANTPYARPGSATRVWAPLVLAYGACTAPNSTHAPPLDLPSCTPPTQRSPLLTSSAAGRGSGFMQFIVLPGSDTTAADESDFLANSTMTDVVCAAAGPGCAGPGSDYSGRVISRTVVRMSDLANGALGTTPATVEDFEISFPADCAVTAGPAGARCTVSSTLDTVLPGLAKEGQRGILSLLSLSVEDAGPDGSIDPPSGTCPPTCGSGDEQRFLDAGLFAP